MQRFQTGHWLMAILVMACFYHRLSISLDIPGFSGVDTFSRLYYRDELVINWFGRDWLPLLQLLINAIYAVGGDLWDVKIMMAILGAAVVSLAGLYAYIRFGLLAGMLWMLWLMVDPDMVYVSINPYQEMLFYLIFMLVVWRLAFLRQDRFIQHSAQLALLGALALLCRYEGILLAFSVALALGVQLHCRWKIRTRAPYLALVVLFIVMPLAWWALYSGGSDDYHSSLVRGFEIDAIWNNARHLYHLFFSTGLFLKFTLVSVIGILVLVQQRRLLDPDVILLLSFGLLFVTMFILISPYQPNFNRRSHIPPLLVFSYLASVGLGAIQGLLAPASQRMRLLAAAAILIAALPVLHQEALRMEDFRSKELRSYPHSAANGAALQQIFPSDKPVLFIRNRGEYHGHPALINMRIIAHTAGTPKRFEYVDQYIHQDPAQLAEHLINTGYTGIAAFEGELAHLWQPLAGALELHLGRRLHMLRLTTGLRIYYWQKYTGSEKALPGPPIWDISSLGTAGLEIAATRGASPALQDMRFFENYPGTDFQLLFPARGIESVIELEFAVQNPCVCELSLSFTTARDYGHVQILLDGTALGRVIDTYTPELGILEFHRPYLDLEAGKHRLRLRVTGKHPESTGYQLGLAGLSVRPQAY